MNRKVENGRWVNRKVDDWKVSEGEGRWSNGK